jgi:ABC-type lipoprotein release transport system permease subunit
MTRVLLSLIRLATPRSEREWVVGDTIEELESMRATAGQRAAQPATYVAVLVVMAVVLLIAAYIPARRAMRIEAIVALRSE